MKIFETKQDMRSFTLSCRSKELRVGFVPTMGSLHEGHISLVKTARDTCDIVVVSIYINPTQFSKNEDFGVYPKSIESDKEKLRNAGCDALFLPQTLYATPKDAKDDMMVVGETSSVDCMDGHSTWINVEGISQGLCAQSRPHFFRGVATVVTKLFNIVDPDAAFFGKKDYQQLKVITRMVRDLDFSINIVGVDIMREKDGLAMSSRNALLTPHDRQDAPVIYETLVNAKESCKQESCSSTKIIESIKHSIEAKNGKIDYVAVVDSENLMPLQQTYPGRTLVAVAAFFGKVRLIDNMEM